MNIDFSELMWLDHHHEVALNELVELSGLSQEELRQLVDSGALMPNNPTEENWHFNSQCIVSIRTLSRLKQDFELEPNAFALTLVFLERIRTLEIQLRDSDQGERVNKSAFP
jgi:chaperone modulatory protein CbpM